MLYESETKFKSKVKIGFTVHTDCVKNVKYRCPSGVTITERKTKQKTKQKAVQKRHDYRVLYAKIKPKQT